EAVAEDQRLAEQLYELLLQAKTVSLNQKSTIARTMSRALYNAGGLDHGLGKLQQLYDRTPSEDIVSRDFIKARIFELLARGGNWRGASEMLSGTLTNAAFRDPALWQSAIEVAGLIGDMEKYKALCFTGVAYFAAGADAEGSQDLANCLMLFPLEP